MRVLRSAGQRLEEAAAPLDLLRVQFLDQRVDATKWGGGDQSVVCLDREDDGYSSAVPFEMDRCLLGQTE
jgi:hypothetical protein